MKRAPAAAPITPMLSFCVQQMAARGYATGRLLAGSGLDEDSCCDPRTRIDDEQELAVYRNILHLSADPAIGLELGGAVHLNALGVAGALLANAADLGHTGYLMRQFQALTSHWFAAEFIGELGPGRLLVRYRQARDPGELHRFIIDRDVRGAQALIVEVFGPAAAPFIGAVAFGYPRPPDAERYAAALGCVVSFGHEYTTVSFDGTLTALPNPRRNNFAYTLFRRQCGDLLARRSSGSWQSQVLNMLASGDVFPGAAEMAAMLTCSERSLRRHLRAEGCSYSELVDRVRFERAAYLLTHSRDPVKAIGYQLGYSEPANFVHAFVRWSGVSPSRYRRSAGNPPAPD